MKKLTLTMLICCSIAALCACGKTASVQEKITQSDEEAQNASENDAKEESESEKQENNTTASLNETDKTEEPVVQQDSDDATQSADLEIEEWKSAYLAYLDALERADSFTYSLIYVDDDEIPELMIDIGYEAGGCMILTFHDGVLDEWQSDRLNVTYIEGGNLVCNSDGLMGHYYDSVYTIQDGKWCFVEGGEYRDNPDGIQRDENGNIISIFIYNWNGEDVSEEEYNARLNSIYPTKQAVYPEKYYILKEMRSLLETGDISSAGHQYELIVEDLTWKEAEAACREKGGYLAAITSWEELERIQEQMIAENKTDVTFFVGANHERDGVFGYHWIEPESGTFYSMLDLFNALDGFWLNGEPSYRGVTEAGIEVDEDYVVLLYRKSDGRCYLNDVPNDILSVAPSYSGRVGYICEYNE